MSLVKTPAARPYSVALALRSTPLMSLITTHHRFILSVTAYTEHVLVSHWLIWMIDSSFVYDLDLVSAVALGGGHGLICK